MYSKTRKNESATTFHIKTIKQEQTLSLFSFVINLVKQQNQEIKNFVTKFYVEIF